MVQDLDEKKYFYEKERFSCNLLETQYYPSDFVSICVNSCNVSIKSIWILYKFYPVHLIEKWSANSIETGAENK